MLNMMPEGGFQVV